MFMTNENRKIKLSIGNKKYKRLDKCVGMWMFLLSSV